MDKKGSIDSLIIAVLVGGVIVTILIAGLNWNIPLSALVGLGSAIVVDALTKPFFKCQNSTCF